MPQVRKHLGTSRPAPNFVSTFLATLTSLADADYPKPGSIWGIDISHWTGVVPDWNVVKASGCRFVIIKAMHGKNIANCFKENYTGAVAAGLPVGHYHWLCPSAMVSPGGQARAYADLCKQYPPTLMACTDFEYTPFTYKEGGHSKTVTTEIDDLDSFMATWMAEYGQPISIYSSPSYWKEHGSTNGKWLAYDLWIANYGERAPLERPLIPAPWFEETFWQFSENGDGDLIGTAPGERRVDLNYFNGTDEEFYARFGTSPNPPPPPGDSMATYKVTTVWENGCTERTAPNTSATYVRVWSKGSVLSALSNEFSQADGSMWIKLDSGNYIATFYGGNRRATVETVVAPPPGTTLPTISGNLVLKAAGYPDKNVVIDEWKPL